MMKFNGILRRSFLSGAFLTGTVWCVGMSGWLSVADHGFAQEPAKPAAAANAEKKDASEGKLPKVEKILFLGNSITLHGPSETIGWSGNWGMAASAEDKDYVHLVLKAFAESQGSAPQSMVENIAVFERQFTKYNVREELSKALEFKPDLVILAIGENVPALSTNEARTDFKNSVTALLKTLKENGNPTIIVRSCFWPDRIKDQILKQAAEEIKTPFVDIGGLAKDEGNFARSEREYKHAGVAGHPGDKGMQAIADALIGAIKNASTAQAK
jgi:lysophospholipase L1-like esterase